jgi:hypothetical protein
MVEKSIDKLKKQMIIDIDVGQLEGIVRARLKDTIETVHYNASQNYVHPEDDKDYKKDIKALKRILHYIGED